MDPITGSCGGSTRSRPNGPARRPMRSAREAAGQHHIHLAEPRSRRRVALERTVERRIPARRCGDHELIHAANESRVSLGALVVAILVSCFTELNVGVLALALAWVVGVYVGGMPLNDVTGGFPVSLFLTLSG